MTLLITRWKQVKIPKIPEKLNDFSFSMDGSAFGHALKLCDEVIRFSSADKMIEDVHMVIATEDLDVYLVGRTIDTFILFKLPCKATASGAASLNFSDMSPVNRNTDVKFSFKPGEMLASASRFKLTTPTKQVSRDQLMMIDTSLRSVKLRKGEEALPPQVVESIKKAVEVTYVPDLYLDRMVNSFIEVKDGVLAVVTNSAFTGAKYECPMPKDVSPMRISLSANMLKLLYKVIDDTPCEFYVEGSHFIANSADFLVLLPPVSGAESEAETFAQFETALGNPAAKGTAEGDLPVAVKSLFSVVNGNKSLKGQRVTIAFKARKNTADLSFESDNQCLTERIDFSGDSELAFRVDIRLLNIVFKNLLQVYESKDLKHRLGAYGIPGKYKAFSLKYKQKDNARITIYMQCSN